MIPAVLCSMILWPAYVAVALVLDLIGLVILLPLSACHAWRWDFSRVFRENGTPLTPADVGRTGRHVTRWRGGWLTWLWGNEEDGVTGPTWWWVRSTGQHMGWWRNAWSAYRWSALRNPTNNLRFIPGINPVLEPARIGVRQARCSGRLLNDWWFCWQGPFAGLWLWLRIRGQLYRAAIGWKIEAGDVRGIPTNAPRRVRCGFGVQFKRVS